MTSGPRIDVQVTRRFSASPERVSDAWLDPEQARKWLFATPTGQMVRAEIDARVGGSFMLVDRRDGQDVEHTGEYVEIDRPRRLVFTFGASGGDEVSRVIVEIAPLESGCELTLTDERVDRQYASRSQAGWTMLLGGLAAAIE